MDIPDNIQDVRKLIYNRLRDHFSSRGGNRFTRINGKDLRIAFDLYDSLVFGSQFQDRLNQKKARIKFFARPRRYGDISICGKRSSHLYYMDIAPNIFLSPDHVLFLQRILERQMIHLLILMWDLAKWDPVYCSEGILYQRLKNRYFGDSPFLEGSLRMDLENPLTYTVPLTRTGLLRYSENSCYLDSLLTVLLLSDCGFYRKNLFDFRIPKRYSPSTVQKDSKLKTSRDIRQYASALQKQLQIDYNRLVNQGEIFSCLDLRKLLQEFYPDLKKRRSWDIYNISAVYDLLSEVFPLLKMYPIPTTIHVSGKTKKKKRKLSVFQMWDFLGDFSGVGEEYMWEELRTEVLVFQNGGIPPITDLGSLGVEIASDSHSYEKVRSFGPTILEGKYELFGAVILHGTTPGRDGGTHYTAFFKTKGGEWCHYDDLGPSITKLKAFPPNIFREVRGGKPELFFYQRRNPPKLKVKVIERPGRKSLVIARDIGNSHFSRIQNLKPGFKISDNWVWTLESSTAQNLAENLEKISSSKTP